MENALLGGLFAFFLNPKKSVTETCHKARQRYCKMIFIVGKENTGKVKRAILPLFIQNLAYDTLMNAGIKLLAYQPLDLVYYTTKALWST